MTNSLGWRFILLPLLLTQLVELPLSLLFARESAKSARLLSVAALNLITNPLLNLGLLLLAPTSVTRLPALLVGESLVLAGETLGLRVLLDQRRRTAFVMSLILNGSSLLVGLLIQLALQ